jgi:hypothetical protein
MKSKLRMRQGTLQKASLSGRHIIEPDDAVARGQQAVDHVTADKACSAGDENAQNNLRMESKSNQVWIKACFVPEIADASSRSSLRPSRTLCDLCG